MALPLIPGVEAARGAPRVEPRLRETSSPKPEAEPKDGTARQERAGAPFGSFLDRAARSGRDGGAQVRPEPRKVARDESAASAPVEPDSAEPVVDAAPIAEGESSVVAPAESVETGIAKASVEAAVAGTGVQPPPPAEDTSARGGEQVVRSGFPRGLVSPPIAGQQPDGGESATGGSSRDGAHEQSSDGRGFTRLEPGGDLGGANQSRSDVARQGSEGVAQTSLLSAVSVPVRPSAEPEVEPREASVPRASDAPPRSAEAPIRLDSPVRDEAEGPGLMRASSAVAEAKPASWAGGSRLSQEPEGLNESPQIVARGLSAAAAQRGGVVHVRLVPESLGEVRIQMSVDALSVSVKIEASTPSAQGLLNEHLAMLRTSLESKGLTVDRLAVHLASPVSSPPGSPQSSGSGLGESGGQTPHHDAGGSPSRGRSDDEAAQGRAAVEPLEEATDEGGSGRSVPAFASRLRVRLSAVA